MMTKWMVVGLTCLTAGCVLVPRKALEQESHRLAAARAEFQQLANEPLPDAPTLADLTRFALLHNPQVAVRFHEWAAAFERVGIAAGYPNTRIALSASYLFSKESLSAWDRTTLQLGTDTMENLRFPLKVAASGKQAMAELRVAAEAFRAAKFDTQESVRRLYGQLALRQEQARLLEEKQRLVDQLLRGLDGQFASGSPLDDRLLRNTERSEIDTQHDRLDAQVHSARHQLAAALGLEALPPLDARIPERQPLPDRDESIFAAGLDRNPEIAAAHQAIEQQKAALEQAQYEYIPDINPAAGITGASEQMAGAMIMLPTTLPQIRAAIREAKERVAAAKADGERIGLETRVALRSSLASARALDRELQRIEMDISPAIQTLRVLARTRYEAGSGALDGWFDAEFAWIELRETAADAAVRRDRVVARIERLTGTDLARLTEPRIDLAAAFTR